MKQIFYTYAQSYPQDIANSVLSNTISCNQMTDSGFFSVGAGKSLLIKRISSSVNLIF